MKPTYKEFEYYIKQIIKFREQEEAFSKAISNMTDTKQIGIYDYQEDLIIKLLEKLMDDKWGNISWWIYEKDFGKKKHLTYKDANNKIIPTTTIKDLYNLLNLNI
jgi:hypothetical protein